ncbi:biopolymer transport protein ExbD/TolR [Candidatus Kuenenia stuttgartiensis]|jgi:biopolymer transport protein ExbD|uniref:Biopolymer transport protein ExbD/TolR n=1 Tax=Kuenenia stuttgartiensis TaxID=174633 RepID=Q1PWC1_KUEST|nr:MULTISPECIES: biopolymer transporter ExbD [Kuenenia]MBE7545933.1 biopolymer transporter ExbD [Planctomycetia bacterium]MCZ7562439.1 biopolymer transporter ExbD [Burkholderiales bacterium]MBW7941088.1 biopolymer transporter ExbD [Candidatus Kuenenia stuttgartiensis]MBZ0193008.1 biopolymer transporter ExbD [Candidatus Kuenenia stuttgartiensis]MCF6152696.1 biopolymer transporter ExbD [Candidatus Kuenenia stuttgartiensis]
MRFREKTPSKSFINLTPLVDMLFIILLFFLVTSTFIDQPNIQLELPTTKHTPTSKVDEQVLNISRDGRLFFQNEPVERKVLIQVLKKAFSQQTEKTLVLRVDKNVPYGLVIDVMDAAKGAGLKKIVAPTIVDPEKQP